jgi:hypothetical protein
LANNTRLGNVLVMIGLENHYVDLEFQTHGWIMLAEECFQLTPKKSSCCMRLTTCLWYHFSSTYATIYSIKMLSIIFRQESDKNAEQKYHVPSRRYSFINILNYTLSLNLLSKSMNPKYSMKDQNRQPLNIPINTSMCFDEENVPARQDLPEQPKLTPRSGGISLLNKGL